MSPLDGPGATGPTTDGADAAASVPSVRLCSITKRYGAVVACADVDLELRPGQVHGILGENGAGKSTLMKILIGLVQPDAGTIEVAGRPTVIHDPQTAADLGIGMVHQHLSLVDSLTVWENVLLGDQRKLDRRTARREWRRRRSTTAWGSTRTGACATSRQGCGSASS